MAIRYLDEEPAQRKIRYLDEAPPPEARGARPESFMEDSSGRRAIFDPGAIGRDRVRVEEPGAVSVGAMPGEPPEAPEATFPGLKGPPPVMGVSQNMPMERVESGIPEEKPMKKPWEKYQTQPPPAEKMKPWERYAGAEQEAPPPEARGARPESFMEDSSGRRVEAGRPPASFMEDSSGRRVEAVRPPESFMEDSSGRRAIFNPGATGRDRVRVEEPGAVSGGAMPGEPPEWPGRVEQGAPPVMGVSQNMPNVPIGREESGAQAKEPILKTKGIAGDVARSAVSMGGALVERGAQLAEGLEDTAKSVYGIPKAIQNKAFTFLWQAFPKQMQEFQAHQAQGAKKPLEESFRKRIRGQGEQEIYRFLDAVKEVHSEALGEIQKQGGAPALVAQQLAEGAASMALNLVMMRKLTGALPGELTGSSSRLRAASIQNAKISSAVYATTPGTPEEKLRAAVDTAAYMGVPSMASQLPADWMAKTAAILMNAGLNADQYMAGIKAAHASAVESGRPEDWPLYAVGTLGVQAMQDIMFGILTRSSPHGSKTEAAREASRMVNEWRMKRDQAEYAERIKRSDLIRRAKAGDRAAFDELLKERITPEASAQPAAPGAGARRAEGLTPVLTGGVFDKPAPPVPGDLAGAKMAAVYRGGPASAVPSGKTALDVVQYERQELGNLINTEIPETELQMIPGNRIAWVGATPESVSEFGEVSKIESPYRVLARDPDGNMLVEFESSSAPEARPPAAAPERAAPAEGGGMIAPAQPGAPDVAQGAVDIKKDVDVLRQAEIQSGEDQRLPETTLKQTPQGVPFQELELPVEQIKLSADVPQFKEGGDPKTGETAPLAGEYSAFNTAPIVVWRRLNSDLEVIIGRHRLALARRTKDVNLIRAHVVQEADGFTKQMAAIIDAESNIRDGQGEVSDYANYFRNTEITAEEASSRGLLARDKGRKGYSIGKYASDDLYAAYRYGTISEAKTAAIAEAAPNDAGIQALGQRFAKEHSAEEIYQFIKSMLRRAPGASSEQLDMFGHDDAWVKRGMAEAKAASAIVNELNEERRALRSARNLNKGSRAKILARYGIETTGDMDSIESRLAAIDERLFRMRDWHLNEDLTREVVARAGYAPDKPDVGGITGAAGAEASGAVAGPAGAGQAVVDTPDARLKLAEDELDRLMRGDVGGPAVREQAGQYGELSVKEPTFDIGGQNIALTPAGVRDRLNVYTAAWAWDNDGATADPEMRRWRAVEKTYKLAEWAEKVFPGVPLKDIFVVVVIQGYHQNQKVLDALLVKRNEYQKAIEYITQLYPADGKTSVNIMPSAKPYEPRQAGYPKYTAWKAGEKFDYALAKDEQARKQQDKADKKQAELEATDLFARAAKFAKPSQLTLFEQQELYSVIGKAKTPFRQKLEALSEMGVGRAELDARNLLQRELLFKARALVQALDAKRIDEAEAERRFLATQTIVEKGLAKEERARQKRLPVAEARDMFVIDTPAARGMLFEAGSEYQFAAEEGVTDANAVAELRDSAMQLELPGLGRPYAQALHSKLPARSQAQAKPEREYSEEEQAALQRRAISEPENPEAARAALNATKGRISSLVQGAINREIPGFDVVGQEVLTPRDFAALALTCRSRFFEVWKVAVRHRDTGKIVYSKVLTVGVRDQANADPQAVIQAVQIASRQSKIPIDRLEPICSHNHPSGDPLPSPADKQVAELIGAACDLAGIYGCKHFNTNGGKYFDYQENQVNDLPDYTPLPVDLMPPEKLQAIQSYDDFGRIAGTLRKANPNAAFLVMMDGQLKIREIEQFDWSSRALGLERAVEKQIALSISRTHASSIAFVLPEDIQRPQAQALVKFADSLDATFTDINTPTKPSWRADGLLVAGPKQGKTIVAEQGGGYLANSGQIVDAAARMVVAWAEKENLAVTPELTQKILEMKYGDKLKAFYPEISRVIKLLSDPAGKILIGMRQIAEPLREIPAEPESWQKEFPNRTLQTPIGEVRLGEHQFEKMIQKDNGKRKHFLGSIKPTLENPSIIVQQADGTKLFIKAFRENGIIYFVSVAQKIDGIDVVISNHPERDARIKNGIQTGEKLYISTALKAFADALPKPPAHAASERSESEENIRQKSLDVNNEIGTPEVLPESGSVADVASKTGQAWPGGELGEPGKPTDDPNFSRLPIEMPELVQFGRALLGGKYPEVRQKLRGALGYFRYSKSEGEIRILAETFKLITPAERTRMIEEAQAWAETHAEVGDNVAALAQERFEKIYKEAYETAKTKNPLLASKVLAHEIGHVVGWLPKHVMRGRGNILGQIASFVNYTKKLLAGIPEDQENLLTADDRKHIRREAQRRGKKDMEAVKRIYSDMIGAEIKRRGLISRDEILEELRPLIAWWRGSGEQMEEYFEKPHEMYAEALSVFLNNPAALMERAPKFWGLINNWMQNKPEVKRSYDAMQDSINSGQIFKERVERMYKEMAEADQAAAELAVVQEQKTAQEIKDQLFYSFDRRFGPIQRRIATHETPGIRRAALGALSDNLYRGARGELILDRVQNEVAQLLVNNNFQWINLGEYLFLRRILRGDRADMANPWGMTPKACQERMTEMQTQYGDRFNALEQSANALRKIFEDEVLAPAREWNIFGAELQKLLEDNIFYATFAVHKGAAPKGSDSLQSALEQRFGQGVSSHIFKQYGTLRPVKNPATATVQKMLALSSMLYREHAKSAAVGALLGTEFADEWRAADTHWTGKRNEIKIVENERVGTLIFLRDGKTHGYYGPRALVDAFGFRPALEIAGIARIFATGSSWLKGLFTSANPAFWPVAWIRDIRGFNRRMPGTAKEIRNWVPLTGGVYWRYAWRSLKAAGSAFVGRPNETAQDALRRGMWISKASGYMGQGTEDEFEREIKRRGLPVLMREDLPKVRKALNLLLQFLEIGQILERTSKTAGMLYLDERQSNMPEELKRITVRKFAGSPDFMEKGAANWLADIAFLFYNPDKEGLRSEADAWKGFNGEPGRWGEMFWNTLRWAVLPTIGLFSMGYGLSKLAGRKGENRTQFEQMYQDGVSERDLSAFYCIPIAWADERERKVLYLRWPKDDKERLIGAATEGGLQGAIGNSSPGEVVNDLKNFTGRQLPGLNPIVSLGIAMGTYWLGKNPDDSFTQKKVLTDEEQELRGIVGAKAMGRYAWNQTVGSLLGRIPAPARPGTPPLTTLEQVLRLPVVSPLLGRWLKVDNAGFRERMEAESKPARQREAQINREVDAAVVLYQKTGKFDPMVRRNIIIGEQIYKAYRGHPPTVENRLKMHYFTRFKNDDKAGKMARKPVEERIQRQQPTVAQRLSVRDAIRRER